MGRTPGGRTTLGGGLGEEGPASSEDQGLKGFPELFASSSFSFSSKSFSASNLNLFLGSRCKGEVDVLLLSFEGGDDGEEEGEDGEGDLDSEL